jgi:CheY-like chemotaxis protein
MAAGADAPPVPVRRVLVVDDSRSVQEAVRSALAELPHVEVTACGDVAAAEKALERQSPDLILCDVVLPGRPGYELCRQVTRSRRGPHPLVFLLSGTFEPFDEEAARQAGADDVLSKPFSPEELRGRLESALAPAARVAPDDGGGEAGDITAEDLLAPGAPAPRPAPDGEGSAIDELAARLEQPLAERLLGPLGDELARRLAAGGGALSGHADRLLRQAAEKLVAERLRRLEAAAGDDPAGQD